MFITNIMFYLLLLLCGVFCVITGIRALRTGEFYGISQEGVSGVKFMTETLIVLIGGIYLIALDIWFFVSDIRP